MESKYEIVKMGSLFLDEEPVKQGCRHKRDQIMMIGNTIPDKELTWVKTYQPDAPDKELYVANRAVLRDISWVILDHMDFIFGRPVVIDGRYFYCRSLSAALPGEGDGEWEKILKQTDVSDELWSGNDFLSWSRTPFSTTGKDKACIVFQSDLQWNTHLPADSDGEGIGFRPALEPIDAPQGRLEDLIGQNFCIYGPVGHYGGIIREVTEYDIVLDGCLFEGTAHWALLERDKKVVIDRAQVMYWEPYQVFQKRNRNTW